MTIRESSAEWQGTLKEGSGRLRLGSGVFEGAYSFPSRNPGAAELAAARQEVCELKGQLVGARHRAEMAEATAGATRRTQRRHSAAASRSSPTNTPS